MKATGSKTRRMAQKGSSKPMETPSWVSDEESYSWFQRRFQGRKMKRGFQGRRKAKERAAKDPLESVFFQKEERQVKPCRWSDRFMAARWTMAKTVNGKISPGMTGPGTSLRSPMPYAAKGKGKFGKIERMESPETMDKPNLQILPRAAPQLPRLSYTFFIERFHVFNFFFHGHRGQHRQDR